MFMRTQSKWWGFKFTPFEDKAKQLIWFDPSLYFSVEYENFERYLGIAAERVKEILGEPAQRTLDKNEVLEMVKRVERLFAEI